MEYKTFQFNSDFTLAYKAFPSALLPPIATNPFKPSSLRAFLQASAHFLRTLFAYTLFALAEAFFDTTLPVLLLTRSDFLRPDVVFSFRPEKTADLACLPFAMILTRFAFFMPDFFMTDFFPTFLLLFITDFLAARAMERNYGSNNFL